MHVNAATPGIPKNPEIADVTKFIGTYMPN